MELLFSRMGQVVKGIGLGEGWGGREERGPSVLDILSSGVILPMVFRWNEPNWEH